ncbi:MAG: hypothetical protein K0R41_3254 [Geminicoccaceae bacterium]|nr:hypothetical protein [Geminicoccaceae bacterium]
MASTALKAPATLEEFLAWEEQQPERYEFLDGVVRMMTGGTEDHDRLSVNLIALLRNALRGGPCSVHASNLKIVSRAGNASMYPELFVRCGPREGKRTRIEDAIVAVEVLSRRTAKDDLTRKRRAYTAGAAPRRRRLRRRGGRGAGCRAGAPRDRGPARDGRDLRGHRGGADGGGLMARRAAPERAALRLP